MEKTSYSDAYYDGLIVNDAADDHRAIFNTLIKGLKDAGYMDDVSPIFLVKKSRVGDRQVFDFCLNYEQGDDAFFTFDCNTGSVKSVIRIPPFQFPVNKTLSVSETITLLDSGMKILISEIIKQGYEVDHKHITKLMMLFSIGTVYDLWIHFADWIPYVYADINLPQIIELFDRGREDNQDLVMYGKVRLKVETVIALNSIHSIFAKELQD